MEETFGFLHKEIKILQMKVEKLEEEEEESEEIFETKVAKNGTWWKSGDFL